MSIIEVMKLNALFVDKIKAKGETQKFFLNTPIFYEKQVPIGAYLIIEGSIALFKNKKVKKIVGPGHLIGLNEVMRNIPIKSNAEVKEGSTLCFLDKTTIQEIIDSECCELSSLILQMTTSASCATISPP